MYNLLNDIKYLPAIRTSRFELAALTELDKNVKDQISPFLLLRSNSNAINDIERFLHEWEGGTLWVDNSRYTLDAVSGIAPLLDNPENHYSFKYEFFQKLFSMNNRIKPVVGFGALDDARSVTQFGLKVLNDFGYLGIRLEIDSIDSSNLEKKIAIFSSLMNAIPDQSIDKVLVVIDIGSIENIPNLGPDSTIMRCTRAAINYNIKHILTLSTSWPTERPAKNEELTVHNIDPIWQAYFSQLVQKIDPKIKCIYGDYASTNPMKDISDDYDPAVMSKPIPFAGYAYDLGWHQYRYGNSGEWEKFVGIANRIVESSEFQSHGVEFCWGNRRIDAFSRQTEESKSNAVWNKIRVNQHITLLHQLLNNGIYENILKPKEEED